LRYRPRQRNRYAKFKDGSTIRLTLIFTHVTEHPLIRVSVYRHGGSVMLMACQN